MTGSVRSRAKLNLSLHITGRRDDGYHLLESVVAFADIGDVLTARASQELTLTIIGEHASGLPSDEDNLVLRAARALAPDKTAHLTLEKNLPIASGIGGGSGDAAAALKLLNKFWGLNLPMKVLNEVALRLGADVPMCLENTPAFVQGTGDIITPIVLPTWYVVLANPGVAIPTKNIFADFAASRQSFDTPSAFSEITDWLSYVKASRNTLQPFSVAREPIIKALLSAFAATEQCLLSRMSGSGATCFGLYEKEEAAREAERYLAASFPQFWLKTATLSG
ncbi:MAG: 4-(cytidine 5'-diphospho)-2-C-methyl-D-erythritol kinase [Rickettsiales bacterium]